MPKQKRTYSRVTKEALILLGKQIQLGRKSRRMSADELAERIGVARSTLWRIEQGQPGVEIGAAFEAAILTGVPLFVDEPSRLTSEIARTSDQLALLPASIRHKDEDVNDDF